ncbi:MAG TPA: hypothetical protein GX707_15635 [Epulopiscium sp.]|nr:hypothetical protein [Candidatus Epulonipiscium sp.]
MNDIKKLEKELKKLKSTRKKPNDFLNIMVKTVFFSTFIFVAMVFVLIWFKGYEPTVLIEWWFKVMVGELVITSIIQISKRFKKKEGGEYEDQLETEVN